MVTTPFKSRESTVARSCFNATCARRDLPQNITGNFISEAMNDNPFQCQTCMEYFTTSYALLKHVCQDSEAKERRHEYVSWKKLFCSKFHPNLHIQTHNERWERQFECNICSKEFTRLSFLVDHIKSHVASKLFSCKFCSKKFLAFKNLKSHMRTHTGEIPCKCELCGQRFTWSSALTNQVRYRHTNKKLFKCETCGRAFSTS